jgi:anti-sigma factor RsiW
MSAERRAVLREFNGNRPAMAAEIVRLRTQLDDARAELSRLAARGFGGVLIPGAPMAVTPPPRRPVGFHSGGPPGDEQQVG